MSWLLKLCCDDDSPPIDMKRFQIKLANKVETQDVPANPYRLQTPTLVKRDSSSLGQLSRIAKKDRYQGEELEGVPHGNGSMLYANGDFYRGEWVNGKKEGRGLQVYQELNVQYQGEWQNDQPYGTGKLTQTNSSSYYVGQFKCGVKHGKGQYYNNETKKQFNEVYDNGQMKDQKEIILTKSKEEELQFPTLALDKERFTTEDLTQFQQNNPNIKDLDVTFLLRYYGLHKLEKLQCIAKALKEWTIKQVLSFLDLIDLKDYKQIFYQNKIKGKDLLSLTESELKDDLKMKMGNRKRFMNYRKFIIGLDDSYVKEQKMKKRAKQSPQSYKFRSATSMKKVLRNVKNYALYEESIQEESLQSERQSQIFHTNDMFKVQPEYPTKKRQYDSADVFEPRSQANSQVKRSSLDKLINLHSQRSHSSISSQRDAPRKDKDSFNQDSSKSNPQNTNAKSNQPNIIIGGKPLVEAKHNSQEVSSPQKDEQPKSSSSSSSEDTPPDVMYRKKTHDIKITHQSSEIRQLYQFLKEHRGLNFLIREKDIEKLQLIGEGGFGKVYKGKYVGSSIAIKDYLKTGKHHHKEDFMKQLQIISDLKHPNIVLYMGMCITANKYTLITEYLQNGSLFDQLHKKKKKFTSFQQIQILFDIVKGMVYLHNMKKILHRDLKSSNVLIGENWQVKLCDFGLSGQKKKSKKKKNTNRLGTFQWMAPQVIRNEQKIDQFADVYSFGVIIWQLLSQKIPYEGLSEQQIIGLVGYDNDHQLETPINGCEFLKAIMRKCLNKVPNARPTFIDIQNEFEQYYAAQKEKMNLN